ncbi:MAG: PAS domain-containing protein, partial [Candidatus Aminicenantes bacterium]|nr:PAS domain-containing protein [Candidatus Aminicenantes bacterium]
DLNSRAIFDGLVEHVVYHDQNMRVIWANKEACKAAGLSRSEVIGQFCYEIWAHSHVLCPDCPVQKAMKSGRPHSVTKTTDDGRTWYIRGYPLYDKDGRIMGGVELTLEITKQEKAFKALKESEEKFRNLSESSYDAIFTLDKNGKFSYISPAINRITGYKPNEFVGKIFDDFILKSDQTQAIAAHKELLSGKPVEGLCLALKGKNQKNPIVEINVIPLIKEKKTNGAHGVIRDVTERMLFEEKLKASIKEKEVMLQEIHHRVKNNLQIISSLLRLQSSHIQDESLKHIFNVSQDRIQSMALIHQMLYQSKNLNSVDLSDYIRKMISRLSSIYLNKNKNINFDVDIKNVNLSINQAIPCGLIINELVSNSLKHAFNPNQKGRIYVGISNTGKGNIQISVKDTGRGLPENFHIEITNSLGLTLVCDLIKQLRGTLTLKRDEGTEFEIIFSSQK